MPREKKWTLVRKNQFKRAPIGKKSVRKANRRANQQEFDLIDPHGPESATKMMTPKSIKRQLTKEANRMKQGKLVKNFVEYLHNIIHKQCLPQQPDTSEITLYLRAYGIGNFSTSPSARKQMALFLATRDYFNDVVFVDPNSENDAKQPDFSPSSLNTAPTQGPDQPYVFSWQKSRGTDASQANAALKIVVGSIDVCDPVFTDLERQTLSELSMTPVAGNDEGLVAITEDSVSTFLIAYMPHCPRTLYNNLISSNFTPHQLSRIIVVGNSFQEYGNLLQSNASERSHLSYILRLLALHVVVEQDLERWLVNLDGGRRRGRKGGGGSALVMTEDARKSIQIEHDAFSFQKIQYFPVPHLLRISEETWESIREELLHEQMIPDDMDLDADDDDMVREDVVDDSVE